MDVATLELIAMYPELRKLIRHEEWQSLRRLSECHWRKGYSSATEKAYLGHANRFLEQMKVRLDAVQPEHVQAYV